MHDIKQYVLETAIDHNHLPTFCKRYLIANIEGDGFVLFSE